MTGRQFEYKIRDWSSVPLTEHYTIDRKPLLISDTRPNGKDVRCKTFNDLFNFVLDDGRKVIDIIETWEDIPSLYLDAEPEWHTKNS